MFNGVTAIHYNKDYNSSKKICNIMYGVTAIHYNKDYNSNHASFLDKMGVTAIHYNKDRFGMRGNNTLKTVEIHMFI